MQRLMCHVLENVESKYMTIPGPGLHFYQNLQRPVQRSKLILPRNGVICPRLSRQHRDTPTVLLHSPGPDEKQLPGLGFPSLLCISLDPRLCSTQNPAPLPHLPGKTGQAQSAGILKGDSLF